MNGFRMLFLTLICLAGCTTSDPTVAVAEGPGDATEYAVSAQRALQGTAYESLGVEGLRVLVDGLCRGLGAGAIDGAIAATDIAAGADDQAIMREVLEVGVAEVCPERVGADLVAVFTGAVRDVAESGGALGAYDELRATTTAPVVCQAFASGASAEGVLVEAAGALFDVEVSNVEELEVAIDGDQGLVLGAVVNTAVSLLCPEHLDAVANLMESL